MVPEEWSIQKLHSAGITITDGDRGKEYPKSKDFSESGYCVFLSAKNVTKSGFSFEDVKFINKEKYQKLGKGKVERGNIVLTTRGTVGQFALYDDSVPFKFLRVNSGMVVLDSKISSLRPDYFYALCRSSVISKQIDVASFGSAQPQLTVKIIEQLKLPIPPRQEQRKIAKILQTWDRAITTTEKLIEASKQQKKALMQQLLTGKKRFAGFEGEWLSGDLVEFAGNIYGGGTPSRSESKFWHGNIPWVTVKDLITTHITGAQEHITEMGLAESSSKIVQAGTPILATRMAIGKVVIADRDVAINQDLKAICSGNTINSKYLFYWLLGTSEKIEKMGTGSTVKGVQIEDIKSLAMRIPGSLIEQRKITACLTSSDKEISQLKIKLTHLKQEKKALMQQLLTGKRRVKVDSQ